MKKKGTRKGRALRSLHIGNHIYRYVKTVSGETIVYQPDGKFWFRWAGIHWTPAEIVAGIMVYM